MNDLIVLYLSISIALLTAWAFQKRSRPQQLTLCRSLHAEALQAIAGKGLAQGPYMAARAGFEPTTLRSNGVASTNAPPCPTTMIVCMLFPRTYTTHISYLYTKYYFHFQRSLTHTHTYIHNTYRGLYIYICIYIYIYVYIYMCVCVCRRVCVRVCYVN